MYLLDTNIWLERLLAQDQAESVGDLLDRVPLEQLRMSDFTLHSIGVILGRLGEGAAFIQFVQDVLVDGGVILVSVPPVAMKEIVEAMGLYRLDFDDAYQYIAAKRDNAVVVSFDRDFDRTDQGRKTPTQILDGLGPAPR